MRKFALSKVKGDLSRLLRPAESEEIVITRRGKPAAVLIGFKSEDDWFDYRLENDPRFLDGVAQATISPESPSSRHSEGRSDPGPSGRR
jgi:prevent-host-death family protein